MFMRKKYRVRRPKIRFGPVLFPLVSVFLLVGTVYGWMSFVRSSSHGFETYLENQEPSEIVVSPQGSSLTPFPQGDSGGGNASPAVSDLPVVAVPGETIPQTDLFQGKAEGKITALPEGFGAIPGGIWILVDKSAMELRLCEGSRILHEYPIGIGKNPGNKEKSGDRRTPEGRFSIENIHDSSAWTHDYKDGRGPVKGVYGPWFLRLRMSWSGLGICGTPDPDLIGKRTTRGSIRMLNKDIEELKSRVQVGTVVVITP